MQSTASLVAVFSLLTLTALAAPAASPEALVRLHLGPVTQSHHDNHNLHADAEQKRRTHHHTTEQKSVAKGSVASGQQALNKVLNAATKGYGTATGNHAARQAHTGAQEAGQQALQAAVSTPVDSPATQALQAPGPVVPQQ